MNAPAAIGHNNPPDPMEIIQSEHDGLFVEVANWLDGTPVENEGQMKAVDNLLASVKDVEKEAKDAKEDEYRPHKAACDAVVERWKPFLADLERMKKGLAKTVEDFKRKLAEEREAERRAKEREAREAMERARIAAALASAADLEAQREAAAAADAARAAVLAAKEVETVKGLRTFTVREVTDYTACARWVWVNDPEPLRTFLDEYVKRAPRVPDGAIERQEKRAV
jgi:hypothetical protein